MLNTFSGIAICGGYFKDSKKFNFFDKPEQKIAIIYGKNGSGKSSIAKALIEYKENQLSQFSNVLLLNYNHEVLNIQEDQKRSIFVFNDDYIRKNVSINENGLETIVMFGKQIDLDEKITTMEYILSQKEKEHISSAKIHGEYLNSQNIVSPQYHMNEMLTRLRKDENWADIDARIKGNKTKSSVSEGTINNLYTLRSSKSSTELKQEFSQKMHEFQQASNSNKINNSAMLVKVDEKIETLLILLLSKKMDQPVISNREKIIMKMLQDGEQHDVEKAKKFFSIKDTKICPFCFQEVNDEYKKSLVESILKVLNKDVDDHIEELKSVFLEKIIIDYQMYSIIDKNLVESLEKKSLEYNGLIEKTEEKIKNKLENLFVPINETALGLTEALVEINSLIKKLEEKREQFNLNIDEVIKIQGKLLKLNKQIFWLDIEAAYTNFHNQIGKLKVVEERLETEQKELSNIKSEIEHLKAEKKNFKIALIIINDYLEYIFFEKNRLKLEVKNDRYYIKSRSNSIKLKELSVGERNVIALCYFFSQLLVNCTKEQAFKNEYLIVLDDPISSFDFENKIGIYSFIRSIFNKILVNNSKSRVVILTHELEATYHFEKICDDISCKFKSSVLSQMQFSNFNGRKHNEYSCLLQQVFRFANMDDGYENLEMSIGNIMRRVLEAFGTFTYKKGIDALSCDPEILELISDEKQRAYFGNLMYRLVLHGESHLEERAKSIPELDFYNFVDNSEKVRTAKDILVFLYLLNHKHVEAHLNDAHAIEQIRTWNSLLSDSGDGTFLTP